MHEYHEKLEIPGLTNDISQENDELLLILQGKKTSPGYLGCQ